MTGTKKEETSDAAEKPEYPKIQIEDLEESFRRIAKLSFDLENGCADVRATKEELTKIAEEHNASFLYESVAVDLDKKKLEDMKKANAETEKLLKEALEDAEVNHGETEVYEATLTIAYHHLKVGDKETTYSWLEKSKEKALSSAQKIDVMLRRAWVAFLYRDYKVVMSTIPAIEKIFENGGGDWDRKNRLKVYKGLISLVNRDFKEASDNFLSVVATFNTYELFSFSEFVILTTLTSMVTLDRVALKKSVVDSPEILSVIREAPDVEQLVLSFYNCDYKSFFQSLLKVHERISGDRFFSPHSDWFVRETRVGAYAQFLKSYLKVETVSMAHAFGVSKEFIDKELARFIAARRLNARMNKITGVIETSYTDERSGDFKAIIKEGDALLNRIQRLSRTINA